jgi:hypothetical protein
MPDSDDSHAVAGGQVDEPAVELTVRELLLARIDEHCRLLGLELDQVAKACEQLAPDRARSCRNAITMASVIIDEIRLRAHAHPLDKRRQVAQQRPPVALRRWGSATSGRLRSMHAQAGRMGWTRCPKDRQWMDR